MAAPKEVAAAETEKSELERLCRKNAQLRMDNEFLGKAAAFFASKQQNRNASN
ncbi:transposase [Paenarthrobacter ureafaciens]|nr:transposase [Paenarthrobacter ureafaciens]